MSIKLMVFSVVLSCIIGGLAVLGILYPMIKKRKNGMVQEENSDALSFNGSLKASVLYSVFAFSVTLIVSLWLLIHFNNDNLIFVLKRVLLISILFVAAYYDKQAYRIPNKLILYGLFCRVVLLIFELIFFNETVSSVIVSELIGAGGLLVFSIIGLLITRNGIGMGDIKLFILMGLFQGLTGVVPSVFLSLLVSFVYSLCLLIARKKSRKDYIAFAPCILVGTCISVMLLGN